MRHPVGRTQVDDGRRNRRRRTEIGMVRESENAREGERNADGRGREGERRREREGVSE